jgi:hypothetical protein
MRRLFALALLLVGCSAPQPSSDAGVWATTGSGSYTAATAANHNVMLLVNG